MYSASTEMVSLVFDDVCTQIRKKVIRKLKNDTKCLESGVGSPLKNKWEEIVWQKSQYGYFLYESQKDEMESLIEAEVKKHSHAIQALLWVWIEKGVEWICTASGKALTYEIRHGNIDYAKIREEICEQILFYISDDDIQNVLPYYHYKSCHKNDAWM